MLLLGAALKSILCRFVGNFGIFQFNSPPSSSREDRVSSEKAFMAVFIAAFRPRNSSVKAYQLPLGKQFQPKRFLLFKRFRRLNNLNSSDSFPLNVSNLCVLVMNLRVHESWRREGGKGGGDKIFHMRSPHTTKLLSTPTLFSQINSAEHAACLLFCSRTVYECEGRRGWWKWVWLKLCSVGISLLMSTCFLISQTPPQIFIMKQ